MDAQSQRQTTWRDGASGARIIPNPKLKRLDQVREVVRLKHGSPVGCVEARSSWTNPTGSCDRSPWRNAAELPVVIQPRTLRQPDRRRDSGFGDFAFPRPIRTSWWPLSSPASAAQPPSRPLLIFLPRPPPDSPNRQQVRRLASVLFHCTATVIIAHKLRRFSACLRQVHPTLIEMPRLLLS